MPNVPGQERTQTEMRFPVLERGVRCESGSDESSGLDPYSREVCDPMRHEVAGLSWYVPREFRAGRLSGTKVVAPYRACQDNMSNEVPGPETIASR